jgi:hypothetical protein
MILFSRLFEDFASAVFGVKEEQVRKTKAYEFHAALDKEEAKVLFIARVLAYAPATWFNHASAFKAFREFCLERNIEPTECTAMSLNVFLLHLAQIGKSIQVVENTLATISFVFRFYMIPDITSDPLLTTTRRFVTKVCPKVSNLKSPFGSYEVRKLWDYVYFTYANVQSMPFHVLRTFVLSIVQFNSFCRFSDLSVVKLEDLVFVLFDYFKIKIRVSKTDQAGSGQTAYVIKSADEGHDAHMLMCTYIQRLDRLSYS